jgi:hypothetical protein
MPEEAPNGGMPVSGNPQPYPQRFWYAPKDPAPTIPTILHLVQNERDKYEEKFCVSFRACNTTIILVVFLLLSYFASGAK